MPANVQEWLALAIVIAVAGLALWRYLARRKARACNACAANACDVRGAPADDEPRVLAKPEVRFTRRSGD